MNFLKIFGTLTLGGSALGLLLHGFGALSLQSICLLCGLGALVGARWLWPGRLVPAALAFGGALGAGAFCLSLGAEGGGAALLLSCGADALLAGALGVGLRRFPPEKWGAGTLLAALPAAAALGSLAWGPLAVGVAVCAGDAAVCAEGAAVCAGDVAVCAGGVVACAGGVVACAGGVVVCGAASVSTCRVKSSYTAGSV